MCVPGDAVPTSWSMSRPIPKVRRADLGLILMGELKRGLDGDAADDFIGDLIERQDFFGQSGARQRPAYPNDAGRSVLKDYEGSGRAKRLESFQAILAHAGQNHTQGTGAEDLRHRGAN